MKRIFTTKIASSLEPPPAMVDKIFDIIDNHIDQSIESGKYKEINVKVPIDTSGWKYEILNGINIKDRVTKHIDEKAKTFTSNIIEQRKKGFVSYSDQEIEDLVANRINNIISKTSEITVETERNSEKYKRREAEWDDKTMTLTIILPRNLNEIHPDQLMGNISHELRHFTQVYLSLAKYGTYSGRIGLPSGQTPDFDQNSEDEQYRSHSMDDREFWPLLEDAKAEAISKVKDYYSREKYPVEISEMARKIIDADEFLNDLKKYPQGQKKREKAISEMFKVINDAYDETIRRKTENFYKNK